jgi:hypothetical protein
MCVITLATPLLGFAIGLLGFEWEEVEGFAYNWWPSCLGAGWVLSAVFGTLFVIVGIMGFTSYKPHTWLGRIMGGSQTKLATSQTSEQAQKRWTEFAAQLEQAFLFLEQMSSLSTPDFFEPGADDVYRENTRIIAQLLTKGLDSLRAAKEELRDLQTVWPGHRRALRTLVSALVEYRGMLEGYGGMNTALGLDSSGASPQELRQIVLRSRRHAEKGDRLLNKGLLLLGKSIEIEFADGKRTYPA